MIDFCTGSHKSSSFTLRKSRTSNNPVPVLHIPSKYGWMTCSLNESNLTRLRHKLQPCSQPAGSYSNLTDGLHRGTVFGSFVTRPRDNASACAAMPPTVTSEAQRLSPRPAHRSYIANAAGRCRHRCRRRCRHRRDSGWYASAVVFSVSWPSGLITAHSEADQGCLSQPWGRKNTTVSE